MSDPLVESLVTDIKSYLERRLDAANREIGRLTGTVKSLEASLADAKQELEQYREHGRFCDCSCHEPCDENCPEHDKTAREGEEVRP